MNELPRNPARREPLRDEQGPIPTFPPATWDENGRYILPGEEELSQRADAVRRTLRVWATEDGGAEDEPNEDLFREFLQSLGVPRSPRED